MAVKFEFYVLTHDPDGWFKHNGVATHDGSDVRYEYTTTEQVSESEANEIIDQRLDGD